MHPGNWANQSNLYFYALMCMKLTEKETGKNICCKLRPETNGSSTLYSVLQKSRISSSTLYAQNIVHFIRSHRRWVSEHSPLHIKAKSGGESDLHGYTKRGSWRKQMRTETPENGLSKICPDGFRCSYDWSGREPLPPHWSIFVCLAVQEKANISTAGNSKFSVEENW